MRRNSPNKTLIFMIIISVGIHLIVIMHVARSYNSENLTYIEISLKDVSKPFIRDIPRPRPRYKAPDIQDVQKLNVRQREVPKIKVDPVETQPQNMITANIAIPQTPDMSGISDLSVGEWVAPPANVNAAEDFITRQDYFDMLRLRIESKKKYPESARVNHMEGRVKVRFVISQAGELIVSEVIKSSGYSVLDTAALSAIKDAAPFPRSPQNLFKEQVRMEITIAFELT